MANLSLEERISRLEDVHEIGNLMGRYVFYLAAGKFGEITALFAQHTPGVTSEVTDMGLYDGIEDVRQYLSEHRFGTDGQGTGFLSEKNLTSPVIEVAKDGKTAKGLWGVPGLSARTNKQTGKPQVWGGWDHNAVHFVKEDGKWKIMRIHVYSIFVTPFEGSWWDVKKPESPVATPKKRPTTYHRPYDPANIPEYVPSVPEPYDTYDLNTPLP
jgi:hypothetical protein